MGLISCFQSFLSLFGPFSSKAREKGENGVFADSPSSSFKFKFKFIKNTKIFLARKEAYCTFFSLAVHNGMASANADLSVILFLFNVQFFRAPLRNYCELNLCC